MRNILIEEMKKKIEDGLKDFLREEGIELYIAANDNSPLKEPHVLLESIENIPLEGARLLSEIRLKLAVQGKPAQCDALVHGIYHALHPHGFTPSELNVLLMSLHVEAAHCVRPRRLRKCTVMRYIVEEI